MHIRVISGLLAGAMALFISTPAQAEPLPEPPATVSTQPPAFTAEETEGPSVEPTTPEPTVSESVTPEPTVSQSVTPEPTSTPTPTAEPARPVVTSSEVAPREVVGGDPVQVTVQVTSEEGLSSVIGQVAASRVTLTRVAGDEHTGTYRGELGTTQSTTPLNPTVLVTMAEVGGRLTTASLGKIAIAPLAAPVIESATVTPAAIGEGEEVEVQAHVVTAWKTPPTTVRAKIGARPDLLMKRVSGDDRDGVYQVRQRLTAAAPMTGPAQLAVSVEATDGGGRVTSRAVEGGITLNPEPLVTPVLDGLAVTPQAAEVGRPVQLQVHATSTGVKGVRSVQAELAGKTITLTRHSTTTAHDGQYSGSLLVPADATVGTAALKLTALDGSGAIATLDTTVEVEPDHTPAISAVTFPSSVKWGQKALIEARVVAFKGVASVRVLDGEKPTGVTLTRVSGDGLYRGERLVKQGDADWNVVIEASDVDGRTALTQGRWMDVVAVPEAVVTAVRLPKTATIGGSINVEATVRGSAVRVSCAEAGSSFRRVSTGLYRGTCVIPGHVKPGWYRVRVTAVDRNGTSHTLASNPIWVKRGTRFKGVDAGPEPVRKGRKITVSGSLWTLVPSKYLNGQKVTIQFARKGTTAFRTMATVTTSGWGTFRKTFRARADGTWRVVYTGTSTYAPATRKPTDYVNVK